MLITGGASGIGESIARSFHAQGSKVAILDYNAEAGQALAKELGERVHFQRNDLRDIPAFLHGDPPRRAMQSTRSRPPSTMLRATASTPSIR